MWSPVRSTLFALAVAGCSFDLAPLESAAHRHRRRGERFVVAAAAARPLRRAARLRAAGLSRRARTDAHRRNHRGRRRVALGGGGRHAAAADVDHRLRHRHAHRRCQLGAAHLRRRRRAPRVPARAKRRLGLDPLRHAEAVRRRRRQLGEKRSRLEDAGPQHRARPPTTTTTSRWRRRCKSCRAKPAPGSSCRWRWPATRRSR